MNKKNTLIIIIAILITIILSVGITLAIVLPRQNSAMNKIKINDNKSSNKIEKTEDEKQKDREIIKVEDKPILEETPKKDNIEIKKDKEEDKVEDKAETPQTIIPESENINIVKYFEDSATSNNEKTLKEGFVNIIDFLFYNKEISGVTFDQITTKTKLEIIKIALKLDTKIEEYFPGYKAAISNTTNKIYTNIKSKLITLYLDLTVKVCSNNTELCEDAKSDLQDLKKSFSISWDFIKDISSKNISKLKDWYEVWKEK